MNIPNELKAIEAKLAILKYEPSWSGLMRITGWTLLFVVLSNALVPTPPVDTPYKENLTETRVVQMNTTASDPRWVREDFQTFPKDQHKNIAWLTASSVLLLKATEQENNDIWSSVEFLPEKVNQILEAEHDIKTKAFLYLIAARRIIDTYTMVIDVIERKPDAIVLILNPLWIYNNKAIYYRDAVFNHGARMWWNRQDWPMQFSLVSPGNHLWNIIGQHISFVSLRHDYQVYLIDQVKQRMGGDLKNLSQKNEAPEKSTNKPEINLMQSLRFWILFREYGGDISSFYPDGKINVNGLQSTAISQAETAPGSWPDTMLRKLLRTLKDSNIPTIVYVAPVSPDMTEPQLAVDAYSDILGALRNYKSEYETDTFKVIVDLPKEVTKSINFQDYIHLDKGGLLPAFLSKEVSSLVSKK